MASIGTSGSYMGGVGRAIVGILSVLAGPCASILLFAASGQIDAASISLATIVQVAGFLGLGITGSSEHPLRPLSIALALAIGASGAGLLWISLPFPPSGREEISSAILACAFIAQIVAIVALRRRPLVSA